MIKVMCDKCGGDSGLSAYEIRISAIHNPAPQRWNDIGDLRITDDDHKIRFILCDGCYKKIGLPLFSKSVNDKNIVWRKEVVT